MLPILLSADNPQDRPRRIRFTKTPDEIISDIQRGYHDQPDLTEQELAYFLARAKTIGQKGWYVWQVLIEGRPPIYVAAKNFVGAWVEAAKKDESLLEADTNLISITVIRSVSDMMENGGAQ